MKKKKIKVKRHGYTLYFDTEMYDWLLERADINHRTIAGELRAILEDLRIKDAKTQKPKPLKNLGFQEIV